MRTERESKRSGTVPPRTRGPKPKPSRDAALIEQRAQLLLLHRRRQQLLQRLELEQQQFAALRQQVERLRQRWEDSCSSNQQLHQNNLALHAELAAAAQAQGMAVPALTCNTMQPPSCSAPQLERLQSESSVPGLPTMAGHPAGFSSSDHMGLHLQPIPTTAAAAAAGAAGRASGSLDRHPISAPGHPMLMRRSSSSGSHSSPPPAVPPVHGMSRCGSAPAWWPSHTHALPSPPPPPAAAAGAGAAPLEPYMRLGGRCSSYGSFPSPHGCEDAPNAAWGPQQPAMHSRSAPFPGRVEGFGSNAQLRLLEVAQAPAILQPFTHTSPTAAPRAAGGELFAPEWPSAPVGLAAPAAGGQGLALLPPLGGQHPAARMYGGPGGGPQHHLLPAGNPSRCSSNPEVLQLWSGNLYESRCIRQPLPGLPDVRQVEAAQQLLLEAPCARAMVTRVCEQQPLGSCSSDAGCLPEPAAITPGSSFEQHSAAGGGSPVMFGTPVLPAGLDSWPSSSSMISGGTVLGGSSPLSSPGAAAASGLVSVKCEAPPQLGTTAAAAVDVMMGVGPGDVEQLLDSVLEQADASWLDMLGTEDILV